MTDDLKKTNGKTSSENPFKKVSDSQFNEIQCIAYCCMKQLDAEQSQCKNLK